MRAHAVSPSLLLLILACSSGGPAEDAGDASQNRPADSGSGIEDAGLGDADLEDALALDSEPVIDPREQLADQLFELLTGQFDSRAQAARDSRYFEVQLLACPVDAPEFGPRVLYVEQAMMTALQEPYRQRIYVVEPGENEGEAVSRVFALSSDAAWVGACGRATRQASATDAVERAGCAVHLQWMDDRFVGGTRGEGCASSLNGATYASSEVELTPSLIRSWDRGHDAAGRQVWGAQAGPYVFDRQP